MHVGIAGEVRCVVTKADGTVKTDTGYQKNLILNQGLDFFGGDKGSAINDSCAIGIGNSAPAITQTKLDTFVAISGGGSITSDYSYVDKGDNLYRMWEQKAYRFTNLDNINVSELGLVSTGSTSTNYYLTTRALIKDSSGAPTSISVKKGETLDIYYKLHKFIDTSVKKFVINVLDGSGGSIPYNVSIKPASVGGYNENSVVGSTRQVPTSLRIYTSTTDLSAITGIPDGSESDSSFNVGDYVIGSYKTLVELFFSLNQSNVNIRSVHTGRKTTYENYSFMFLPFQMRLGRVSDDAPLTKTNKDTLSIPLEFSWGRYEGAL